MVFIHHAKRGEQSFAKKKKSPKKVLISKVLESKNTLKRGALHLKEQN